MVDDAPPKLSVRADWVVQNDVRLAIVVVGQRYSPASAQLLQLAEASE